MVVNSLVREESRKEGEAKREEVRMVINEALWLGRR